MKYRYRYFSGGRCSYVIERKKEDGDWKFCFGVENIQQAMELMKNPLEIEAQLKIYKIMGIVVLSFLAISLLMLTIVL